MSYLQTVIPSPPKIINQGPTVQQYNTPIFNFYQQNFGSSNINAHKFIEPIKAIHQGPIQSQIQLFPVFPFDLITSQRNNNFVPIQPVIRTEGPVSLQIQTFFPKVYNYDPSAPVIVPKSLKEQSFAIPNQTYIFPPFDFAKQSQRALDNYFIVPTKQITGPTSQQYNTPIFSFYQQNFGDSSIKSHKFIEPIKRFEGLPIQQTYIFPVFNFDFLKITYSPIIKTSNAYSLVTITTSTGFWCGNTGMSSMTAGGSINDLGGH